MNSPVALLFTDFHAHLFKDFSKPDETYGTDRFKRQIKTLETILEEASNIKVPVIFGGDLFHKRGYVDIRVFNAIFEVFANFPNVNVYLLRGNHDSVTNSLYTDSSLDTLGTLKNVIVVSTPRAIELSDSFRVSFMPYGEEVDLMKDSLNQMAKVARKSKEDRELKQLLVAHLGVAGATTGRYSHTLEGAFSVADLYPDVFDFVYLGHYHKRQELLPNVIYGGNTIQTSFSDEGQTKGYHELYITNKGLEAKYIEIPNPQFITITGNDIPNEETLKNNYIRFVGNPEQAKALQKMKTDDHIPNLRITVEKDYHKESRLGITTSTTESDIVKAYINSKGYPESVLSKALGALTGVQEGVNTHE